MYSIAIAAFKLFVFHIFFFFCPVYFVYARRGATSSTFSYLFISIFFCCCSFIRSFIVYTIIYGATKFKKNNEWNEQANEWAPVQFKICYVYEVESHKHIVDSFIYFFFFSHFEYKILLHLRAVLADLRAKKEKKSDRVGERERERNWKQKSERLND